MLPPGLKPVRRLRCGAEAGDATRKPNNSANAGSRTPEQGGSGQARFPCRTFSLARFGLRAASHVRAWSSGIGNAIE